MDPNYINAHVILANAYELNGMYEECFTELLQLESRGGTSPEKINALKQAYAATGWKGFWRWKLEQMLETSDRKPGFQKDLAIFYAGLGEKDRALACLNKAYEEHDTWLVWIKVAPFYDTLRSDPRFTELVRKVGLPL